MYTKYDYNNVSRANLLLARRVADPRRKSGFFVLRPFSSLSPSDARTTRIKPGNGRGTATESETYARVNKFPPDPATSRPRVFPKTRNGFWNHSRVRLQEYVVVYGGICNNVRCRTSGRWKQRDFLDRRRCVVTEHFEMLRYDENPIETDFQRPDSARKKKKTTTVFRDVTKSVFYEWALFRNINDYLPCARTLVNLIGSLIYLRAVAPITTRRLWGGGGW